MSTLSHMLDICLIYAAFLDVPLEFEALPLRFLNHFFDAVHKALSLKLLPSLDIEEARLTPLSHLLVHICKQ
jgi:hypothetical protein